MPAIIANAPNFLINTDYPFDKVIYLKTGSISTAAGSTITIPHGLGFTPLIGGSWATTADFSISYEYGSGSFPSGNIGYIFSVSIQIYADGTNIYLTNQGNNSTTAYYRIFGFEPDDVNVAIPSISSSGDNFLLDTDYNNRKLFANTHFAFATGSIYTINHSLGYIPQVLAWAKYSVAGYAIFPSLNPLSWSDDQGTFGSTISLQVTTTQLIFTTGSVSSPSNIYYKIYLDA